MDAPDYKLFEIDVNNLNTSSVPLNLEVSQHPTLSIPNDRSGHTSCPTFQFVEILHDSDRNQLNPHLYKIKFSFAGSEWYILRSYNELAVFFEVMAVMRTKQWIPRLTKSFLDDSSYPNDHSFRLVSPVIYLSQEEAHRRIAWFVDGMETILSNEILRNTKECMRFIEVSQYSFDLRLGLKMTECLVKRRTGGYKGGCTSLRSLLQWRTCWLIIKPSFVAYSDVSSGDIRGVLLVDCDLNVREKADGRRKILTIYNTSRSLTIRLRSVPKVKQLISDLTALKEKSIFTKPHRFCSFAPMRACNKVKWIVDGSSYFNAVADYIELAQKQIFITGWFLSPELHLKRPPIDNRYRLDRLLRKKAEAGVSVFILLYKEIMPFVGNNSAYSKKQLCDIHPNIKVLRYPDHVKPNPILLWANHEKSVIIDQTYAFVGGIDLCYGRWDDCDHRLSDLGASILLDDKTRRDSMKATASRLTSRQSGLSDLFQSMDAYLRDSCPDYTEQDANISSILYRRSSSIFLRGNANESKMAFDYIHPAVSGPVFTLQRCVSLESGLDMNKCSRHMNLIEMCIGSLPHWSNPIHYSIHQRLKDKMLLIPRLIRNQYIECSSSTSNVKNSSFKRAVFSHKWRLWIGKDYSNVVLKDFCDVNHPFTELIDRTQHPRMPWHDVGMLLVGQAANDVARHFIQRWNFTKQVKQKNNKKYPILLPESPLEDYVRTAGLFNCDVQILRSVGSWSSGQHNTERSIYKGYMDTIKNAKHYIYIENQFFISHTNESAIVRNRITDAIFNRIKLAISKNEDFYVYVVIPLMPAFEGAYDSPAGVANQTITHWNYRTISHGADSIIARLCSLNCNPFKYISFCALRNWGYIKSQLVTEMVYVHSKIMIVDDQFVIAGSANINDRSMLGNRDSEIAVFIEDREFFLSKLRSKTREVGKFASSLRVRLMREHLGDLNDPCTYTYDAACPEFFNDIWQHAAAMNTMIYAKVFNCIPSDGAKCYDDIRRLKQQVRLCQSNVDLAHDLLRQLAGYLVLFPLKFLQHEHLLPSIWKKEALVPSYVWT